MLPVNMRDEMYKSIVVSFLLCLIGLLGFHLVSVTCYYCFGGKRKVATCMDGCIDGVI